MKNFSIKRVGTAIKNSFRINRSVPILIFVLTAIIMFLSITLSVSSVEDGFVSATVDSERYSWYVSRINNCWNEIIGINGIQCVLAVVTAIGSAILSSITLTAFSRDRKGCDFWSSQPLTRREHITANLISGFLSFFASIVPTWYLSLAIGHMFTTVKPMTLLQIFAEQTPVLLFVLLFYLSVEAVCFLAVTVSGSVMSALVFMATLLGYPALMTVFTGFVSGDIFDTYLMDALEHNYTVFAYSSPILRYFFSFSEPYAITAGDILLYAVSTALIVALLLLIVKKRRLELSQEAVVFPILRYPLQYLWSFFFSLLFAWFLYNLIWSPVWFFIGAIIGLLLSFMVLNMIFERSFTGLFKRPLHLVICAVAFALFVILLVADVCGIYKEPTPNFKSVERFSVYYYENGKAEDEDPYYSDWIDIWSDSSTDTLDSRDREKIELLWRLLEEAEDMRGQVVTENAVWYNIHINVWCKNDPTSWRSYSGYYTVTPEVYEILDYLKTKFQYNSSDRELADEYAWKEGIEGVEVTVTPYEPVDTEAYIPDGAYSAPPADELIRDIISAPDSIGIIGGADGPTAIIVGN